jgi:hypothetical protein
MSFFASPTPYLLTIILAQWALVSYLLGKNSFDDQLSAGMESEARACRTSLLPSVEKMAGVNTKNDLVDPEDNKHGASAFSDPPHGVFVTVVFKAPKWFHLRYVSMLHNALSNLPQEWKLQIFLNQPWVEENLPSYHPGWNRVLSDPRVLTTTLPDYLLKKKPKYIYQDPWFWHSMNSDRVFLFSGNGAFCGNTRYNFDWLEGLDYVGSHSSRGVGGDGSTHSYRNRTSMLAVLDYAALNNLNVDSSTEYEFFVSTMVTMNKAGSSRFRLASREETYMFGGATNLTDETGLRHLPLIVSGTLAKLSFEERDNVLKHCPEIKLIFPSLHEPACFGAHPNAEKCRNSICALQEIVPSHGC